MVDLEASNRSEQNSEYSKKLMYGSLLCLSTTFNFDDLIIAIVSNSDDGLLNQGLVSLLKICTWKRFEFTVFYNNIFVPFKLVSHKT